MNLRVPIFVMHVNNSRDSPPSTRDSILRAELHRSPITADSQRTLRHNCYQFLRTDVREPHPLKKIDENAGWLIAALTMSPLFLTLGTKQSRR